MRWYIPSWHGDITLDSAGDRTIVKCEELTQREADALRNLREHSIKNKWSGQWDVLEGKAGEPYRVASGMSIDLKAPIDKVERFLSRQLKPNRETLRAVIFADGKIARVIGDELAGAEEPTPTADSKPEADPAPKPEPEAGATVAVPVKGCPLPAFEQAEIRATRVLRRFLSPMQLADFNRRQQFVQVGADTGKPYLLTSRHARKALEKVGPYSVYDLEERRSVCVHDWEVPASEELLGIMLHLAVPRGETFMRGLPD